MCVGSVCVGGECQQFRGPRGPILSRKESATEINEARHGEERQSHWCRPRAATLASLQKKKPQLPRCSVPLSKSRQYRWQFSTLGSLLHFALWGFLQLFIYRYTRTISSHTQIHTHVWEHSVLYIYTPSKLHFVSHTLTLTPNIAVLGSGP